MRLANQLIDEEASKIEESSTNNKENANETNKEIININDDQEKKKDLHVTDALIHSLSIVFWRYLNQGAQ